MLVQKGEEQKVHEHGFSKTIYCYAWQLGLVVDWVTLSKWPLSKRLTGLLHIMVAGFQKSKRKNHKVSWGRSFKATHYDFCNILLAKENHRINLNFSSVQLLSRVWLLATPWTAASQASLSITNSWSFLKLMSIESVMPSNHLIICCPLLLPPSIFPSIRVFSNESALHIRWRNYWSFSFSISPSNEYSGLISFSWTGWISLRPRDSQEYSPTPQFKSINSVFSFLYSPTLTSIHDYWKNHSFD